MASPQLHQRARSVPAAAAVDAEETRWVSQVRQRMESEAEVLGAVAKVFDVPQVLWATRPEAYAPQHFSLGPYHHYRRAELMDMERYKLAAAKRAEGKFVGGRRFDDLVKSFVAVQDQIKAPYHRFLELNEDTLAWIMAIDTDLVSSSTSWINAVVRDALMLENQIPLFLFARALDLRRHAYEETVLRAVLDRFIREVCPIKTVPPPALDVIDFARHAHLLELLYHFLVPAPPKELSLDVVSEHTTCAGCELSLRGCIMSMVPLVSKMMSVLSKLLSSKNVTEGLEGVKLDTIILSPLAQEIMIPSVSELAGCGVRFAPEPNGVAGISFDAATETLSLPILHLDGNTEVILRNLVAFETTAVCGQLVLARYTELMNGIVDTADDIKILRECGVVMSHMKSDKEAADMWNGMCRAVRPSKVVLLDGVIREVNAHWDRKPAVRARKLLRRYVFRLWGVLTLLAAVVLLLMTALQTFCSAYDCKRWFGGMMQMPGSGA